MDEPLKLPELPEHIKPLARWNSGESGDFTSRQVRKYGLACARAALEEAAKVCDALPTKHADIDSLAEELVHMDCAAAIRNLKVGE